MTGLKSLTQDRVDRAESRKESIIHIRDQEIKLLKGKINALEAELTDTRSLAEELEKLNIELGAGLIPDLEKKIDDLSADR